ncbi:MAG TPA: fibronectin type III domain-containing protein, partial [Gammaproteobacteria bacterium]
MALLLGLLVMLPEAVLAQCPGGCTTPQSPPPAPVVPSSYDVDGNYQVTVHNGMGSYGYTLWNTGQTSPGNITSVLSVIDKAPGTYSYRAKRCYVESNVCSNWGPYSSSIYVVPPPNSASFGAFSPNACGSSLTVNWAPGSGYYSSSASKRYDLELSSNGGATWSNWGTNYASNSKQLPSTTEGAAYRFKVRSYFYLNGEYSPKSAWTTSSVYTMPECPPVQPAAPALSQLNPNTGTNISISWDEPWVAVGDILGYHVQRRNATLNTAWVTLGGACATSNTSCTDSEAHTRGQTYQYRIQAYKSTPAGSSPWSAAKDIAVVFAQPSTPSTPAFSNVAPHDYGLSWSGGGNGNTGAITYKLWEKVGGGNWTNVYSGAGTGWSPATSRVPVTAYQYKVAACNNNSPQQCTESAVSSISFPGMPGAVTISGIGNAGRNYTLSWDAATGDVTGYELMRSADNGQNWSLVPNQDGVSTAEAIVNATAGTGYQYKVRACNSLACGEYSSMHFYWVPQMPVNLSGSANPNTPSVTVTWTGNSLADHYELQQSINGGQAWGSAVSVSGTSYSPAGETNGTDYTYRVRACNSQGACSSYTSAMTIRLEYAIPVSPAAPAININGSAGTLSASWAAVSGHVETYKVEQSTNGTNWTQVQNNGSLSYAPGALAGGTTYYLRVSACHVDGCSNPGAPASAYLPYATPSLPVLTSTGGQIDTDIYGAGWSGDYAINWASGGGIVDTITVEEQDPGGAWQAASLTAGSCGAGQCSYNKPPNYSGDTLSYRYRAQACNTDNCSGWKEITVQINAYLLPGVPASFTVSQGPTTAGDYTLRWTRPAGTEEVHYYYLDNVDTTQTPDFPAIAHDDNQSYFEQSFSGGQSGQIYRYRVRACYQDDNGCDAYTAPLDVYIPYPAPNQPGSLGHSNLDPQTGSYTLSWTAPAGEVDYYELQRQMDDGQWLAETTTSLTAHTVNAHPNGETRSYRVRACNADDCGDYTDPHAVYVPHLEPGLPADLAIQSLDAAERRMTLGWNAPAGGGQAQTYELQQSTDDGSNWTALADTASPAFNATGLINGTTYHFRVRACNVDGCGDYGVPVQGYLPYAAPDTPGAISHNAAENDPPAGAFTVHWAVPAVIDPIVAPVTHYQLDYSVNGGLNWQPAPVGATSATTYVLIDLDGVLIPVSVPVTENSGLIVDTSVTLSGLTTGAYYSVRVRACNADACGQSTEPYQVYLPHPAPSTPGIVPTEPSAADHASRRFTVQWASPLTGTVNHYQLEAYAGVINGGENWLTVVDKTPATAYTFTDRAYGQIYRYRVRACSEAQASAETCSAWAVTEDI